MTPTALIGALKKLGSLQSTTLDDWCIDGNRTAQFRRTTAIDSEVMRKFKFACTIVAHPSGNYISANGYGDTTGDAFLSAIVQIEKTIGEWR